MSYSHTRDNGMAGYKNKMHVSDTVSIMEGSDSIDLSARQYANLVYVVGTGASPASSTPVSSIIANSGPALAQEILVISTKTYFAEADPGSQLSAAVWRARCITDNTSTINVRWADGNGNFDNVATNLSGLNYLP